MFEHDNAGIVDIYETLEKAYQYLPGIMARYRAARIRYHLFAVAQAIISARDSVKLPERFLEERALLLKEHCVKDHNQRPVILQNGNATMDPAGQLLFDAGVAQLCKQYRVEVDDYEKRIVEVDALLRDRTRFEAIEPLALSWFFQDTPGSILETLQPVIVDDVGLQFSQG